MKRARSSDAKEAPRSFKCKLLLMIEATRTDLFASQPPPFLLYKDTALEGDLMRSSAIGCKTHALFYMVMGVASGNPVFCVRNPL